VTTTKYKVEKNPPEIKSDVRTDEKVPLAPEAAHTVSIAKYQNHQ
jgi:hypothetical protein